jgi:uncharacterized protein YeaO (DUF488 family)
MIHLKRVYEKPSKEDGVRVLVERLWPRGLTKERAAVDLWLKDVAPSPELDGKQKSSRRSTHCEFLRYAFPSAA